MMIIEILRARNPGDRTRSFGCPREGRKTVFLYITPSNSITLVYLIEVPALMQNLDSEDGDMESFLTCCSKFKY